MRDVEIGLSQQYKKAYEWWLEFQALSWGPVASGPLSPRKPLTRPRLDHCLTPPASAASFSALYSTLSTLDGQKMHQVQIFLLGFPGSFPPDSSELLSHWAQYQPPMILRLDSLQSPLSPWSLTFLILSSLQSLPFYLSISLPLVSLFSHLSDTSYNSTSSSSESISSEFLKSEPCSFVLNN